MANVDEAYVADNTPHTRPTRGNWAAVFMMIAGFSICTVAFIAQIIWLGIVGAVLGAAGVVTGKLTRIMEHSH